MAINSHIQIPKSVLKQFDTGNGQIGYLDMTTGFIGFSSPKTLGTKYGYYSEEMEAFLNIVIEKPFSSLANRIRKFVLSGADTLDLSMSDVELCRQYVAMAMSRSQMAMDEFMRSSITAAFCDDQTNHDDLVYFSINSPNGIPTLLKSHKLLLMINRTSRQFVVPRNCFYGVYHMGCELIVAPISPICAIELAPEEYTGNIVNGEDCRIGIIDNPDIVGVMNLQALRYEYRFNKAFVVSAKKDELEQLRQYLEGNRDELQALVSASADTI